MSAQYPNAVKSFTTRNAGDVIQPSHTNDLQDEVNAIEAGLLQGTAPLNSSNSTVLNLSVTRNSTLGSTITIGGLPMIFPAAGGSTGQVLGISSTSGSTMTLGWITAGASRLLGTDFTDQSVTNSSVETSVLNTSAGYEIAANTLVAGKCLAFRATGNAANNSGGAIVLTVKAKLGGTAVFTGAQSIPDGMTVGPWVLQGTINANNASNSQRAVVTFQPTLTNIANGSGVVAGTNPIIGGHTALAIDMSSTQRFDVTLQWTTGNSSATAKRYAAVLELIG